MRFTRRYDAVLRPASPGSAWAEDAATGRFSYIGVMMGRNYDAPAATVTRLLVSIGGHVTASIYRPAKNVTGPLKAVARRVSIN